MVRCRLCYCLKWYYSKAILHIPIFKFKLNWFKYINCGRKEQSSLITGQLNYSILENEHLWGQVFILQCSQFIFQQFPKSIRIMSKYVHGNIYRDLAYVCIFLLFLIIYTLLCYTHSGHYSCVGLHTQTYYIVQSVRLDNRLKLQPPRYITAFHLSFALSWTWTYKQLQVGRGLHLNPHKSDVASPHGVVLYFCFRTEPLWIISQFHCYVVTNATPFLDLLSRLPVHSWISSSFYKTEKQFV